MQRAISMAGCSGFYGRLRDGFFRCSIFHFNWYETPYGNRIRRKFSLAKKLLVLYILRITGKKVIYTLHNRTSHLKEGRIGERKIVQDWFIRHAYSIVIHSRESISFLESIYPNIDKARIKYVPHPNYINAYPDSSAYSGCVKKTGEIVLLFIGMVIPHKNIDVIIRTAYQLKEYTHLHFLLCGKGTPSYQSELSSLIDSENITADFRFINDEEIPSLLNMCDAVLLPYSTISELNSGATYLAFSFGKTVIGTWTGTTRDVDSRLVYCYENTEDKAVHTSRLKEAVLKFYADFTANPEAVREKGRTLQNIMLKEHSLEKTSEALRKAYGLC